MTNQDTSTNKPAHPSGHAAAKPNAVAYVMEPSGVKVTYGELEQESNRAAQLFRAYGLKVGDGIVLVLENHPDFFKLIWGAQRAGLRYTCVSPKLSVDEVDYIVRDCGARILVTSDQVEVADRFPSLLSDVALFNIGKARDGYRDYHAEASQMPTVPIADQAPGSDMLYSSGTTGRPKGITRAPLDDSAFDAPDRTYQMVTLLYGMSETDVYLCPAPLYHAAPLHWSAAMMRLGGTAVIMEKFDAELALQLIERHKVTLGQFVPTHFIRMLKLPDDVRTKYDLSSLRLAVHAAAPCPIPTKEAMISWWGPIIQEYYSGTEAVGLTMITSQEWLNKKGSVGKAMWGEIKICGENEDELPVGEVGDVYFASDRPFSYHNDSEKTAKARNKHGWVTMGDVGRVDEDGYLFLTDRKTFMIISGGVNIYPQEIENLLVQHPSVGDVAVIGAPDDEMGERVVAIVEPDSGFTASEQLADELIAFCRSNMSHIKCPKQIDFMEKLPRGENGKLYKRRLRDAYWDGQTLIQ